MPPLLKTTIATYAVDSELVFHFESITVNNECKIGISSHLNICALHLLI